MEKRVKVLKAGKHIEEMIMKEAKNKDSLIYNEMSYLVGFYKIGNTPVTQGIQYEIIETEDATEEEIESKLRENEIIIFSEDVEDCISIAEKKLNNEYLAELEEYDNFFGGNTPKNCRVFVNEKSIWMPNHVKDMRT